MLSLDEARARVLELAEPTEGIEVPLADAAGLVLAEPLAADVDLPPCDRAAHDGYAVRAADAVAGARLRVLAPAPPRVGRRRGKKGARRGASSATVALHAPHAAELSLNAGEAVRVIAGSPLPMGADAVVRAEDVRPESAFGLPGVVALTRGVEAGCDVIPRGRFLRAGETFAEAGSRLRLPMVGLLASQGCVHPVCHRRVRVAVFAVGEHWVGPGEAPVLHRERNASGAAVLLPCLHRGAVAHDLGAVPEEEAAAALHRALGAAVVVVLGAAEGAIPAALEDAGVSPQFDGVSLHPGEHLRYGVCRDEGGRVRHHVFHMAPGPVGVMAAMALLVEPLIARLQGGPAAPPPPLRAAWDGRAHRAADDRHRAVPVNLSVGEDARLRATPIEHRGGDDLPRFARAEALAVLPPRRGPVDRGDVVEVVPLGSWPPGTPAPSAWA